MAADVQSRTFAFKCHRQTVEGVDTVYPVHALAFHPMYAGVLCNVACGRDCLPFPDAIRPCLHAHCTPMSTCTHVSHTSTFATGGGDGFVNTWDAQNKKRLRQMPRYPTSVSALAFSADGAYLAVASSYCFEQGDCEYVVRRLRCLCLCYCYDAM